MSPVRLCNYCGRPRARGRRCACNGAQPAAPRRPYSDTALYRRMLKDVLATYGESCALCGAPTDPTDRVLAHVIAHADGGAFELDNLRVAHGECNRRAGRAPITGDPRL